MPRLLEIQQAFSAAVFDHDTAILLGIRSKGLSPERRIAIYRNNTFLGLAEALSGGFPVVQRLVGADFFEAMARAFVAAFPPFSGCLLDYGGEFSGFIEGFAPAASAPYLPDMARLEWAWRLSFHADDARCFGLAELAALPPTGYAGLTLRLHPSVQLLQSAWPLLRIYAANQPDVADDELIDLRQESGCRVLVVRDGLEVGLHELKLGEQAFLGALEQSGELEAALHDAGSQDPAFEATASLVRLLNLNVFYHPGHCSLEEIP